MKRGPLARRVFEETSSEPAKYFVRIFRLAPMLP
jgi:hypothetical protein